MATPIEKTRQEMMMPILRPAWSATGAEARAPKKVPTDRMETTRAFCEVVMAQGAAPEAGLFTAAPKVQSLKYE